MSTNLSTKSPNTVHDLRRLLNPVDGPGLSVVQAAEESGVSRQSYYNWKDKLSETDQEMEDHTPGFHVFGAEREVNCVQCGTEKKPKLFKTQLRMNRFCSLRCRPFSKDGA